VLLLVSTILLPTISTQRSVYVETQRMVGTDPNTVIVFFGENPHGASFHLSQFATSAFPLEWEEEFVGFAAEQADFVLVTDDARIEKTRQRLESTHRLTVSPRHKRVYLATRIEQSAESVALTTTVNR
jgi:hypothetical protein